MERERIVVPIDKISNSHKEKCQSCGENATHCVVKLDEAIPCCTKQICIFPLLQAAEHQE